MWSVRAISANPSTTSHTSMCWTAASTVSACLLPIGLNEDGDPYQTIDMDGEQWSLAIEEITDIEQEKENLVKPFDLNGGRLFHVRLLCDKEHYYLFLDYHHIIVDGTSMQVMLKDIDKAYHGEAIAPEEMTLMYIAN